MNNQAQTELPLHQHGAFYDVQAALIFISQTKDALLGISDLLQPELMIHVEQLNAVLRSQVAAIFLFFGAALAGPVEIAYNENERLQRAVEERGVA